MKKPAKFLLSLTVLSVASIALAQTVSFEMVLDLATKLGVFNTTIHPTLERAEANEAESIKNIALAMYQVQMATQPQSRDAHAKGHGCVQAKFTVEEGIPADLQVGTFAHPGETLDAIIRYSNGAGKTQTDGTPDGRGMAVKVIGAAPNGNLLGSGTTQDFMMINAPEFFIGSIKDYALFNSILVRDGKADAFVLGRLIREALADSGVENPEQEPEENIQKISIAVAQLKTAPLNLERTIRALYPNHSTSLTLHMAGKLIALSLGRAPLELTIIKKLQRTIGSSVTEPYFSMASYLLKAKSGDTAVKYVSRPLDCQTRLPIRPKAAPANASDNYLREDLATTLAAGPICYELYIQLLPTNVNDEQRRTLVEDSRLDYNTEEIPVARLILPAQNVDTPAKQQYCENLSFNPWQAGVEHQPLGGMNRARKVAVTASSIRRHLLTGNQRQEPVSIDEFSNLH